MASRRHTTLLAVLLAGIIAATVIAIYARGRSGAASVSPVSLDKLPWPRLVKVSTPAIGSNGVFEHAYTCDGSDTSPMLTIELTGNAAKAKSLLIVMFDPDAPRGVFIHWLVYNIPVNSTVVVVPDSLPRQAVVDGFYQGVNDFGWIGYGGPCPPPGDQPHRYYIRVFALDSMISLRPGLRLDDVWNVAKSHIIAYGEAVGTYSRAG
ncbi:YbhB/YbcL family Raf kinase inhibitor-like protein [Hyperthermus butylicus]|uniref:Phospholipid-binding protein n=1 Tax=Hyperthermus butylicus (strain DSM 5456 / JCM 9403 / PLM1-5) TaxID=415426 RepID=A2BN05_HYPBU|nr:YbhB/YbcL family Raf kinase inhibitor-like protein [Hyperthermus butylicus]ABM81366.1 putative phospholipid-binding protein [Hyperthermus butylicus DSM 5456]